MNDEGEADDSSQEARVSEVRKLVDDVLDKIHEDGESLPDNDLEIDSDDGTNSVKGADEQDDFGRELTGRKRKSNRSTRWKGGKQRIFGQKGRNRRLIFKKLVIRSPASCAVPVTSDFIFDRGLYYQVGDIVSFVDEEDGDRYYAQIRGFLSDEYCQKFAAVNWLIPTHEAPDDGSFDPAFYFMGPAEDTPRPLKSMHFEMHCPSDFFREMNAARISSLPQTTACIWTTLSTRIVTRQ